MNETDDAFPLLKNDLIIRVVCDYFVERVPVWMIDQSSWYLPEFRELVLKHSFQQICHNPQLISEATLLPIKRYKVDAAILFGHNLIIPEALGMKIETHDDDWPVLVDILDDISILKSPQEAIQSLKHIFEAISVTRFQLKGDVPLIGFAISPWTLMCYMLDGNQPSQMSNARRWMYSKPEESRKLLALLTETTILYMVEQIKAGAQLLQLFEYKRDYLLDKQYLGFVFSCLMSISNGVRKAIEEQDLNRVPLMIHGTGSVPVINYYKAKGYDWKTDLSKERITLKMPIQGNLNPCILFSSSDDIKDAVKQMILNARGQKFIANLGDPVPCDADPDKVAIFVDSVRIASQELNVANIKTITYPEEVHSNDDCIIS